MRRNSIKTQRAEFGLLNTRGETQEDAESRISDATGIRRTSRMRRDQAFGCYRDVENLKNMQRAEFELLNARRETQEYVDQNFSF
jgi:hypothetical protein